MNEILAVFDKDTGVIIREYDMQNVRIVGKKQIDSCRRTDGGKTVIKNGEGRDSIDMGRNTFIKNNHLELREVLKELDVYEQSVLTSMMNYIEYWSNCVVIGSNHSVSTDDIAEISGVSRRKVFDVLKSLEKKKLIARTHVGDGKALQYYINPWIAIRGNMVNATLKTMFKDYPIRTKGMKKWKEL